MVVYYLKNNFLFFQKVDLWLVLFSLVRKEINNTKSIIQYLKI